MARSFKQPIRILGRGGMTLLPETSPHVSLRQVILISLIPGDTANPHHRAANRTAPGAVYQHGGQAAYLAFVQERFEELERQGRARLNEPPTVQGPDDSGIRHVFINYTDLESGEVDTIREAL